MPGAAEIDHRPVVKLFTADADATWPLTETDPDEPDIGFGLCDFGPGYPKLGAVRLSEIRALRERLGLPGKRDLHVVPGALFGTYADRARRAGAIVTCPRDVGAGSARIAPVQRSGRCCDPGSLPGPPGRIARPRTAGIRTEAWCAL